MRGGKNVRLEFIFCSVLLLLIGTDQAEKIYCATFYAKLTIIEKMVALPFIGMHCKSEMCRVAKKATYPSKSSASAACSNVNALTP